MKKFISSVLIFVMLCTAFVTASADNAGADVHNKRYTVTDASGEDVVWFTYSTENGIASITDVYVFNDNIDLVFPAEIEGYPVKTVREIYFATKERNIRDKIKSITFEDGIEIIDECDFDFADNLTSLKLPNTLKEGDFIFRECPSLEYVNIPSSLKEIPEMCFFNCASLKEVHIEDGVQSVGASAFGDCKNLTDVELPDSVLYIKKSAFERCESLKSVNLPKNLEYIGDYAFYKTGIEQIKFPSKLKDIEEHAFGYTPLKEIKLPDSLESIGYAAFKGCRSLTKAYIPKGIMDKPNNAFYDCSALSDVTFDGEITKELYNVLTKWTPWGKEYADTLSEDFVIFDGNYLASYKGTDKNPVIPDGITEIAERAFEYADIDSVTFPKTAINEIPSYCFIGSKIKEITIPATVKKVSTMAFYGCESLESVTIEDGVESVADSTFLNCFALDKDKVNIGKSVRVSKNAFKQSSLDEDFADMVSDPEATTAPTATPEATPEPKMLEVNGADMSISVDGKAVDFTDAKPFVDDNDRTQVPVRAVAEMLDCDVDWNGDTKTATITRDSGVITLTLGSDIMTVNGKDVKMDTSVIIKDNRTYIPVRFAAEALGLAVEWK